MSDPVLECPRCHRLSLLVRESSTWCFSGCSIFAELEPPTDSGTVPEPASTVFAAERRHPSTPVTVLSAPETATPRPQRRDVDDWDSSPPAEGWM